MKLDIEKIRAALIEAGFKEFALAHRTWSLYEHESGAGCTLPARDFAGQYGTEQARAKEAVELLVQFTGAPYLELGPLTKREEAYAAELERLSSILRDLVAVADDSDGVAGYHLNGNIAKWEEFEFMRDAQEVAGAK